MEKQAAHYFSGSLKQINSISGIRLCMEYAFRIPEGRHGFGSIPLGEGSEEEVVDTVVGFITEVYSPITSERISEIAITNGAQKNHAILLDNSMIDDLFFRKVSEQVLTVLSTRV